MKTRGRPKVRRQLKVRVLRSCPWTHQEVWDWIGLLQQNAPKQSVSSLICDMLDHAKEDGMSGRDYRICLEACWLLSGTHPA